MELIATGALGRSFRRGANEEAYRRTLWQHRQQQDRERRQKQEEVQGTDSDFIDLAATIITTEQAELFQTELYIYQEATYEALRNNEERLEAADVRIQGLLAHAHVLDDGRRVFKTVDGQKVFDEFGSELAAETILPGEIADDRPRWESYVEALEERENLVHEREQLLDFQADLDEAQELLDSGKTTQAEFEEHRACLREHAPDAVKAYAEGIDFDDNPRSSTIPATTTEIDLGDELSAMALPTPATLGLGQ